MITEIKHLIAKEILLEWRQKYALGGILLYVVSTVFVCFLSFKKIADVPTWNALFWIIVLFASVNAVAKSFIQESRGRLLYYYTLASPQAIILSKIIYNALLVCILSLLTYVIYCLMIGNPVKNFYLFFFTMISGSIGLSSILTLVSAIASKANNSVTLMSVLSFPVILPLLIVLVRLSKNAIDGINWSVNYPYFIAVLSLNVIVIALAFLLFPYLWKD
jgi:heme exporter protein B